MINTLQTALSAWNAAATDTDRMALSVAVVLIVFPAVAVAFVAMEVIDGVINRYRNRC